MLDTDHFITCTADRPDDFVEFQVQCTSVPILSVLDQKNDEKRDNRGCGIYDLLPGVRIMKKGPAAPQSTITNPANMNAQADPTHPAVLAAIVPNQTLNA